MDLLGTGNGRCNTWRGRGRLPGTVVPPIAPHPPLRTHLCKETHKKTQDEAKRAVELAASPEERPRGLSDLSPISVHKGGHIAHE